MMKTLFEREEVEPDKPDNRGGTPLLLAAFCGHKGVLKILGRDELMREAMTSTRAYRSFVVPVTETVVADGCTRVCSKR